MDTSHEKRQLECMPRQLCLEYLGAIHRVMNRGDRREPIFREIAMVCDYPSAIFFVTDPDERGI